MRAENVRTIATPTAIAMVALLTVVSSGLLRASAAAAQEEDRRTMTERAEAADVRPESQPETESESQPKSQSESQVIAVESAFAKTMADRDHEAFSSFLSDEAVFLGQTVLRGRESVADGWRGLFEGETAPFSWQPETVEVLESGNLAISTGPVYDPEGKQIAIFTSIWRQEEAGVWRVIFDRGNKYCE